MVHQMADRMAVQQRDNVQYQGHPNQYMTAGQATLPADRRGNGDRDTALFMMNQMADVVADAFNAERREREYEQQRSYAPQHHRRLIQQHEQQRHEQLRMNQMQQQQHPHQQQQYGPYYSQQGGQSHDRSQRHFRPPRPRTSNTNEIIDLTVEDSPTAQPQEVNQVEDPANDAMNQFLASTITRS